MNEHSAFILVRILIVTGLILILESYVFRKKRKAALILLLSGISFLVAGVFWHSDLIKDRRRVVPNGEENIFLSKPDQEKRYKEKVFAMLERLNELQLKSRSCDFCLENESKVEDYYQDINLDLSRFADFYRNNPDSKFFAAIMQFVAVGDKETANYFLGSLYLNSPDAFLTALSEVPEEGQKVICEKTKTGLVDNPVSSDDKRVIGLEGICSRQAK